MFHSVKTLIQTQKIRGLRPKSKDKKTNVRGLRKEFTAMPAMAEMAEMAGG